MIARLKGIVDAVGADWAVIDVGGVGYLASCSSRTLARLPRVGEAAGLYVETQVREDAIQLYGFADEEERAWFRLLLTVQGVGGRVALALLSALAPGQIAQAIAGNDRTSLSRAQGVGAKLAARLVTELKDKAAAFGGAGAPLEAGAVAAVGTAAAEAVSALVNLGYRRLDAEGAIARAAAALGDAAATGALVTAGLRDLGREIVR